MKRKEFLRGIGLAGIGLTLKSNRSSAKNTLSPPSGECVLIPSETAGPFPLDLTENSYYFRQDIREEEDGVLLTLKMKIIGQDNCEPMQNVRVNIWHCSKDGLYSGYNGNNNPNQEGKTYLRGYQFTDVQGEVEFTTILPGWYNGRICHIHFQVFVSSSYAAISQLTFPLDIKNTIYADNPSLYAKGADPLDFSSDNIFSDGHDYQLATLEEDELTGGYKSYLEATVQGSGTTGLGNIEKETFKVFELGQNYPNPYENATSIPFKLKQAAQVKLSLWDLSGRQVAIALDEHKPAGSYEIEVVPGELDLPSGNYMYQLEARVNNGIYRLPKMMTYINS